MTAIDKFIRLEAVGWWFEAGRQEAREVIVSFGDATLQIASLKDQPLTHWALLATKRVGTRGDAVIYSADPEQHEVLEIEDREMIRAISAVTSALVEPAPQPKWRQWLKRGLVLGALAALLWAAPVAIYKATTLLTPPAGMAALSDDMADSLRSTYGAECSGWLGARALEDFAKNLMPDHPIPLLVFEQQSAAAIALPNAVSLSGAALREAQSPDALAAMVVAQWAMGQNRRPLAAYVAGLGPVGALKGLVAGRFPAGAKPVALTPDGQDYLIARDYLQSRGLSAFAVQQRAKQDGIGLPLGAVAADGTPFTFADFALLQNICDE